MISQVFNWCHVSSTSSCVEENSGRACHAALAWRVEADPFMGGFPEKKGGSFHFFFG